MKRKDIWARIGLNLIPYQLQTMLILNTYLYTKMSLNILSTLGKVSSINNV